MDLGTSETPKLVNLTNEMPQEKKTTMIELFKKFQDVFVWSWEAMQGLDPRLYEHQIYLSKEAKLVVQRRYWMNPNYAAKVKEEMDKLLGVRFIRP